MTKYITLENHNPTEAEKLMYKRHGLYLVKRTNNTYEYNIVHFQDYDNFKEILKVEENVVDKDSKLIFNDDGTITIQNLGLLDKIGTGLINMRRNEILNQQHLRKKKEETERKIRELQERISDDSMELAELTSDFSVDIDEELDKYKKTIEFMKKIGI